MTLLSVMAYHSFSGEVEASNTPTIRRLTPSCRHQLPRIALRALTARSDDAQSSSVVSIEIPVIHDLRIMVTDGFRRSKKAQL
jgi:hypothetical protein